MKKIILIISLISGFACNNAIAACSTPAGCIEACGASYSCMSAVNQISKACDTSQQCNQAANDVVNCDGDESCIENVLAPYQQ